MLNKKVLFTSLMVASIMTTGCATTKPTYNHWNMASHPKEEVKRKGVISQDIEIEILDNASRYFSYRDIESSLVISLVNHGLYSFDEGGQYTLSISVEEFDIDVKYGASVLNETTGRSEREVERLSSELAIRYILKPKDNNKNHYERIFKTKHNEHVKITGNSISDVIEEAVQNNYTSFISNIRKSYF
jgi:uncharacterized lipoprotein YajG